MTLRMGWLMLGLAVVVAGGGTRVGWAGDCDEIVADCNGNGVNDFCDIYVNFTSYDFDDSGTPDECDIEDGILADCNNNGLWDYVDVFGSVDFQGNPVGGTSSDCNNNTVPDECEMPDCNANGVPDVCDIREAVAVDCNGNGRPDGCDVADGTSEDCDENGVPDECDVRPQLAFVASTVGFINPEPETSIINPIDVQVGDLDGDGDMDLVTANRSFPRPWNVGVLLNAGGGVFAPGVIYGAGMNAESLALADFDGDDDLDVAAVVEYRTPLARMQIDIFMNNGSGGLSGPTGYLAGSFPIHVIAADLDGDLDDDLVTANIGGSDVSLLFNNGAGGFGPPTNVTVGGTRPLATAAGDFDHDNDVDLAVCVQTTNTVVVLRNGGGGVFVAPEPYPMNSAFAATDILAADLDGDTYLDLVLALAVFAAGWGVAEQWRGVVRAAGDGCIGGRQPGFRYGRGLRRGRRCGCGRDDQLDPAGFGGVRAPE